MHRGAGQGLRHRLHGSRPGRSSTDPRQTLEAILHKARTGCTWRNLPAQYGPFGSIASAFIRWHRSGLWDRAMEALEGVPGTPLPGEIHLPALQVEGRLDPRLLIGTQVTPGDSRSWHHDH
ncbi:transposase [Streptomyces sp. NBC_00390]|uniref:transposase n=1 Tax=Streptomyces sp. NBC_00390 TaxID=2975736 RepID=UPI003FCD2DFB